ncbi:hypothetical protein Tco_1305831 [Tanacetum coccineum]
MDDVFPTKLLPNDLISSGVSSGDTALLSFSFSLEDKLFDPGIREHEESQTFTDAIIERLSYLTIVKLPVSYHQFLSLPFDHRLLPLLELRDIVALLSFSTKNEDTFFDPGITTFTRIHYFNLGSSHRSKTLIYILLNIFYESPMKIVITPDLEDSRARGTRYDKKGLKQTWKSSPSTRNGRA